MLEGARRCVVRSLLFSLRERCAARSAEVHGAVPTRALERPLAPSTRSPRTPSGARRSPGSTPTGTTFPDVTQLLDNGTDKFHLYRHHPTLRTRPAGSPPGPITGDSCDCDETNCTVPDRVRLRESKTTVCVSLKRLDSKKSHAHTLLMVVSRYNDARRARQLRDARAQSARTDSECRTDTDGQRDGEKERGACFSIEGRTHIPAKHTDSMCTRVGRECEDGRREERAARGVSGDRKTRHTRSVVNWAGQEAQGTCLPQRKVVAELLLQYLRHAVRVRGIGRARRVRLRL